MRHTALAAAALIAGLAFAPAAHAQDCAVEVGTDAYDLDEAQVIDLYDCIKDSLAAGYAKAGHEVGSVYRDWTVTSTRPAVAGPHGERFLQTFANDIAAEEYLKFAEEGVEMPVGSILAKESYKISAKNGKLRRGPLFLMTKVGLDEAPETLGWLYGGVQPNGKVMKVKQSFCHDCHAAYEEQDALAYPLEEVRISSN